MPPSAALAGIYAAFDNQRGVWKAPANVAINYVSKPTYALTDVEQARLTVDAAGGKSVNAIRPSRARARWCGARVPWPATIMSGAT
ncbi:MAG: hypothetical protein WKG07_17770 [Hymenobacter sp.]